MAQRDRAQGWNRIACNIRPAEHVGFLPILLDLRSIQSTDRARSRADAQAWVWVRVWVRVWARVWVWVWVGVHAGPPWPISARLSSQMSSTWFGNEATYAARTTVLLTYRSDSTAGSTGSSSMTGAGFRRI